VLSTLLQDILHPSHHLLNVLLQIANKLGLSNKKKFISNFGRWTKPRNPELSDPANSGLTCRVSASRDSNIPPDRKIQEETITRG
jgi:hypothetical protein